VPWAPIFMASDQSPAQARRSLLALTVGGEALLIWSALYLLLYGYELFNFSLSVDEEIHTFSLKRELTVGWLSQGRWGMALLSTILPPLSALPVLSTALFGAGLVFANAHLASYYRLSGFATHVLAVVLISSPVWPHVVEYNSLAHGVGLGLVVCVLGIRLLDAERWVGKVAGILALAFAIGCYQSFVFVAVVVVLGRALFSRSADQEPVRRVDLGKGLLLVMAATLVCLGIQQLAMSVAGLSLTYVQAFWRVELYRTEPLQALTSSLVASARILSGTDPIYLGYGFIVVALPLAGAASSLWRKAGEGPGSPLSRALCLAGMVLGVVSPLFVSVGRLPVRALVAAPVLFSTCAASVPWSSSLARRLGTGCLAALLLLGVWTSSTLFHSEHLARDRDRLLAHRILERLEPLQRPGKRLKFTLFGKLQPDDRKPIVRVQMFGTSFFEHDGGNVLNVHSFFRLLGADYLTPRPIFALPEVAATAATMPSWPASGSVALIHGIAVVKLGPLSPQQRQSLCKAHPGHGLCQATIQ
jgi:hypothetical protein